MPPAEGSLEEYDDHKRPGEPVQRGIKVESGQDLVKRPGRLRWLPGRRRGLTVSQSALIREDHQSMAATNVCREVARWFSSAAHAFSLLRSISAFRQARCSTTAVLLRSLSPLLLHR